MYTTKLNVSDYVSHDLSVSINASWIAIVDTKTGKTVYERAANNGPWYDASHVTIVNAIRDLERAIFAAVDNK